MNYSIDFKNIQGELVGNIPCDTFSEVCKILFAKEISITDLRNGKVKIISDITIKSIDELIKLTEVINK